MSCVVSVSIISYDALSEWNDMSPEEALLFSEWYSCYGRDMGFSMKRQAFDSLSMNESGFTTKKIYVRIENNLYELWAVCCQTAWVFEKNKDGFAPVAKHSVNDTIGTEFWMWWWDLVQDAILS